MRHKKPELENGFWTTSSSFRISIKASKQQLFMLCIILFGIQLNVTTEQQN